LTLEIAAAGYPHARVIGDVALGPPSVIVR
jgi:hypothetical protein